MAQNTGIGGLANVINAGLTSYRDTKRDVEDRDYIKEQRGLQKERGDTAYAQQQTVFAQQQNDVARQDKERAMADQAKAAVALYVGAGKTAPIQSFINSNGKEYGYNANVSIEDMPDGSYMFRELDPEGNIASEKPMTKDDMTGIARLISYGPTKVMEMRDAVAVKNAERANEMGDWGIKQVTEDAFKANDAARQFENNLRLKEIESQNRIKEEKAKAMAGGDGNFSMSDGVLYNKRTGQVVSGGLAGGGLGVKDAGKVQRVKGPWTTEPELRNEYMLAYGKYDPMGNLILDPDKPKPAYEDWLNKQVAPAFQRGGVKERELWPWSKDIAQQPAQTPVKGLPNVSPKAVSSGLQNSSSSGLPAATQNKAASPKQTPAPKTPEEYSRIPSGAKFLAPDGTTRIKP